MGCIELSDGVTNRRVPVPGLSGTVRIELGGEIAPRVIVPAAVEVERQPDYGDGSTRNTTASSSVVPL